MRGRLTPKTAATVVALAATMVAACSSGGASLDTVPPRDTSAPRTTVLVPPPSDATTSTVVTPTSGTSTPVDSGSSAPIATTVPPGTVDPSSPPTTLVGDGVARLSVDGPWTLVDSAPGVTTPGLVYELMPKLWVFLPTVELPGDDSSLFVPTPADIPIIEAYLRARLVFFRAITSNPIDFDDPGWAEQFTDAGASYFAQLSARRDQGQVGDLSAGVVLRPYVLADQRTATSAVVFDCVLDGGVFRMPDGSLAPGSSLGTLRTGIAAAVGLHDGRWKVERVASQQEPCL